MERALLGLIVLAMATSARRPTWAEEGAAAYATMAPVAQYLMVDRNAEIALARSAAPPAISGDATIMVLGRGGYDIAASGHNGFVCLVERSWMSPFDAPEFWNPKLRGPVCYNPPAARSILPRTVKRTALALAGRTKPALLEAIKAAVAKKELPKPEIGSMLYMMSHQQYLGDEAGPWMPHLMFPPAEDGCCQPGARTCRCRPSCSTRTTPRRLNRRPSSWWPRTRGRTARPSPTARTTATETSAEECLEENSSPPDRGSEGQVKMVALACSHLDVFDPITQPLS